MENKLEVVLIPSSNIALKFQKFTAIIELEDDAYISICSDIDIVSQGLTIEEAKQNLVEAIELFLEVANSSEITKRLKKKLLLLN